MSRRKYFLLKIILCLFLLNLVTVFFYFFSLHHRDHQAKDRKILTENGKTLTENHHSQNQNLRPGVKFHGKPWPILPSYLPWTPNPNVRTRSCDGYFGNGFTQRIDVLKPADHGGGIGGAGGGWFRCFYSETLQSSICEGGRVRMDPEKIKMSKGGEKLEEVIGRKEEVELPEFDFGAFEIENGDRGRNGTKLVDEKFLDRYIPRGAIDRHTMRDLLGSIQLVGSDEFQCAEWVEEPTLLVTRFEYANLFHTVTDWYSAYVASRVTALPNRPHLVFVDGHCKTPLEETWEALFSSLRYAKNFSNSVCFRHAILTPLGYETPLFKGLSQVINCQGASAHDLWQNPDDKKTARLSEFGEMIRAAFGFPLRVSKPVSGHNILFVRREDYLAHPRHGGRVQSRLSNEEEVFNYMKRWLANTSKCRVNLVNGLFAHMPLKEQVRAIQDASVIVGAHGAGLTHIVSATPKTVVFELISSEYRRPHFALISGWKGLDYHPMNLDGSYAKPGRVIDKLSSILSNLGC